MNQGSDRFVSVSSCHVCWPLRHAVLSAFDAASDDDVGKLSAGVHCGACGHAMLVGMAGRGESGEYRTAPKFGSN